MVEYLDKLDSVFWLTLGGLFFGFFGVVLRYCFKSKCSRVSCCCLKIERDIEAEIEEQQLELQVPSRRGSVDDNV